MIIQKDVYSFLKIAFSKIIQGTNRIDIKGMVLPIGNNLNYCKMGVFYVNRRSWLHVP